MIIAFDLDGTITNQANIDFLEKNFHERESQYKVMTPNKKNIVMLKKLKKKNLVYIFTTRHLEHKKTTEAWLKKQKIPFNYVIYDKPFYDILYDDKAIALPGGLN